jgi:hypothetical protein
LPWDFDRKMASPTESAVRLDQAAREHSGAGILNRKTAAGRLKHSIALIFEKNALAGLH